MKNSNTFDTLVLNTPWSVTRGHVTLSLTPPGLQLLQMTQWGLVNMAPFPDEVDVFTGPHWRMKQLVGLYCEKVRNKAKFVNLDFYKRKLWPRLEEWTLASMLATDRR